MAHDVAAHLQPWEGFFKCRSAPANPCKTCCQFGPRDWQIKGFLLDRRKERPPPWTTTKLDALFSAKMNGTYQVGMYYVYGIWDEDTQFTNSCMNTVCTYLLLLNCMLSAFLAYEKMKASLLHFWQRSLVAFQYFLVSWGYSSIPPKTRKHESNDFIQSGILPFSK